MSDVSRFILVRHGETVGDSSIRYHGNNDVALSRAGRIQAERLVGTLPFEVDCVVSSPLCRAWQTATVLLPRASIEIEPAFKEIHFGRWEGLTREEIEACDPDLHSDWQARAPGFEFPEGEPQDDFQRRIREGLERLLALSAESVLVVAHKGVVRHLAETLTHETLPDAVPDLGELISVQRKPNGSWSMREDFSGR